MAGTDFDWGAAFKATPFGFLASPVIDMFSQPKPQGLTSAQQKAKHETGLPYTALPNGTYSAPAAPQPVAPKPVAPQQDNSNPFAGKYGGMDQRAQVSAMQAAIDRQAAIDKRRSNLENLSFTRQANPYADGNAGLMSAKSGLSANFANQFQRSNQAFGDDIAARGLSMSDGLAQNQSQAMRMNEATARAGGLNALDTENYGRQVAFDQSETQAQRSFDRNKAEGLDAFSTGNYELGDRLSRTAFDMGQRAERQPYEIQGLAAQNRNTGLMGDSYATANRYQAPVLEQGLRAGDQQYRVGEQQLDQGRYTLADLGRQDQIGAANLPIYMQNLEFQNSPAMRNMTQYGQMSDAFSGLIRKNLPWEQVGGPGTGQELMKTGVSLAGRYASGGLSG